MASRITQVETFDAEPARIYDILIDGEKFSAMSGGAPAEIDPTAGGAISLFGGMITGRMIENEPGSRVVQAWRAGNWDAGVYSIVRFDIEPDGEGARVSLDHAGFPDGEDGHLAEGWKTNYWTPIRAALANS